MAPPPGSAGRRRDVILVKASANRDAEGTDHAYFDAAGRAVHGEAPKYRFPAGFRKSQVLFNLARAIPTGARQVIVVEGFFDALKVHQAGHPGVVALMGSFLSQRQSELLRRRFDRVTLLLDGDQPGRHAAEVIARLLASQTSVHQIELPSGVQPDQLSSVEINALFAR